MAVVSRRETHQPREVICDEMLNLSRRERWFVGVAVLSAKL